MAPRLSRPADPNDPEYQSLERRINLALHFSLFCAGNSALWFWQSLHYAHWQWLLWFTSLWAVLLLGHGLWVLGRASSNPRNTELY